jgi:nitroreductase|uniref:Putative NADPH dependent flavin oxidoreductase n=1 Tax=Agrobacterium sp. IP I-671 TaxID=173261 RepID=Q8VT67_9HYPH|nr:putative NADPH dependent flavin oxidoreductase [Agrobacterium sp. IP I-671]
MTSHTSTSAAAHDDCSVASAFDRRYGAPTFNQIPSADELVSDCIALMLKHRSVRRYTQDPLPAGTLEILMAAGQSAATSSNMQTVSVIAVTDPEMKARLARTCAGQDFIANAPLLLCFVTDLARPARIATTIGADLFALPMIDTFLASISDCSIFAQNVVLAAESLGMGTCYVGSLRNRADLVSKELNVPSGSAVLFGLCIGYEHPERITNVRPRFPQKGVRTRAVRNRTLRPNGA